MRIIILFLILATLSLGCGDQIIKHETEDIIFMQDGILDSAVVYGCYSYTSRYFVPDTFSLESYGRIVIELTSATNSDGTSVTVFYNTDTSQNVNIYSAYNETGLNKRHRIEFINPKLRTWFEVRLYINPPVCGKGEFKFVSVRDLRIKGIK
jgi:hypothetical protein